MLADITQSIGGMERTKAGKRWKCLCPRNRVHFSSLLGHHTSKLSGVWIPGITLAAPWVLQSLVPRWVTPLACLGFTTDIQDALICRSPSWDSSGSITSWANSLNKSPLIYLCFYLYLHLHYLLLVLSGESFLISPYSFLVKCFHLCQWKVHMIFREQHFKKEHWLHHLRSCEV